jgi:hypothetical protein
VLFVVVVTQQPKLTSLSLSGGSILVIPQNTGISSSSSTSQYCANKRKSVVMGLFFSRIFQNLFGSKEVRILILGLDNAGKTTILCKKLVFEYTPKVFSISRWQTDYKMILTKTFKLFPPLASMLKSCNTKT